MRSYISLLALFMIIFLSSCANRSVYIPLSQNTPLFNKNRQLKATGYIGANHIELQGALNPVNHFAVAGNINFGAGIATYDAAAGIYGYTANDRWRYELFAGYGFNTNYINPSNYISLFSGTKINYDVNSVYNRTYLQPCIGYFGNIDMYKLHFSFSASARVSYILFQKFQYREVDVNKTASANNPVYIVNRDYENKNLYLLEPCITNKVGRGNLYGILQLQGIIYYSNQVDLRFTNFSPRILFSAGIQYDFNLKKRKHR